MTREVNNFFNENNYNENLAYIVEFADGSGWNPSVNDKTVAGIVDYLVKEFKLNSDSYILDLGAGIGHMQLEFEKRNFINVFSFEGNSDLCARFLANKKHLCRLDFAKSIEDERLKKQFDLIVSFEVFEHQTRENIDIFLQNIKFMTDKSIHSIHIMNEENHYHKTIATQEWWEDKFNKNEFQFLKLETFNEDTKVPWECSIYYILRDKNV